MAGGKIAGSYAETFEGVFSTPAVLTGTVELIPVDRGGAAVAGADRRTLRRAGAGSDLPGLRHLPGRRLPGRSHPGGARVPSRRRSSSTARRSRTAATDAYAPIRACVDDPSGCFDPIALHCAQAHFYRAIKAGGAHVCPETGSADCAQRGLLDTFKGLLIWNSVYGNEHMVRAYAARPPARPSSDSELATARAAFARGLLGDSSGGAQVRGLLDPFFAEWASRLPATVWANTQPSMLAEELTVGGAAASKTVPAFGDFDRMKADLGLWIEALRQRARNHAPAQRSRARRAGARGRERRGRRPQHARAGERARGAHERRRSPVGCGPRRRRASPTRSARSAAA